MRRATDSLKRQDYFLAVQSCMGSLEQNVRDPAAIQVLSSARRRAGADVDDTFLNLILITSLQDHLTISYKYISHLNCHHSSQFYYYQKQSVIVCVTYFAKQLNQLPLFMVDHADDARTNSDCFCLPNSGLTRILPADKLFPKKGGLSREGGGISRPRGSWRSRRAVHRPILVSINSTDSHCA